MSSTKLIIDQSVRHIVTSGARYLDIDGYGGVIAEAELLGLLGYNSLAVTTPELNESITPTIRSWGDPCATDYHPSPTDRYTLIDVSDPEFFDPITVLDRVERVLDHHPGFETYWDDRLGTAAQIEPIGAACTMVAENWIRHGQLSKISQRSAGVLMSGILDNTLNFGAVITTDRDHEAYKQLEAVAGLPNNWAEQYFSEVQASIMGDIAAATVNDAKTMHFLTFAQPINVGQIVVWDSYSITAEQIKQIKQVLTTDTQMWAVNVIDLQGRHNRIISDNPEVQDWFKATLNTEFAGNEAKTDRMWLRKEIIAQDIAINNKIGKTT